MDMGVDEACRNEGAAMVVDAGCGVAGAQGVGGADIGNQAILDQNRAVGFMAGGGGAVVKGVARKGQHLPQNKIGH
jgi:hypothetical protein